MADIMSAKCTVCGKIFEGENCVEKAEEHEKIEVIQPLFEIGDVALIVRHNLDTYGSTLSIRGYDIESIDKMTHEHKYEQYNNGYTFRDALRVKSVAGGRIALTKEQESDLLSKINVHTLELIIYEINKHLTNI